MSPRTVALVGLIALAGCERPTAPEARDLAQRTVDHLERGFDRWWIGSGGLDKGSLALAFGDTLSDLELRKDGHLETVHGFVVETAFVPPNNLGVTRYRRSVLVWPKSHQYYVVGTGALDSSSVGRAKFFQEEDYMHPAALLALQHYKRGRGWSAREGTLEIGDGTPVGVCPLSTYYGHGRPRPLERVTCEVVMYLVEVHAQFVTEVDAELPTPEYLKPRHLLALPRQRIMGIRFTTYCLDDDPLARPDSLAGETNLCLESQAAFWRDNALFDRSLGVDVSRMDGKFPPTATIVRGNDDAVRRDGWTYWTLHAPDGRLLESDSVPLTSPSDSIEASRIERKRERLSELSGYGEAWPGWGGHTRSLVNAHYFHPPASYFSFLVLDYEVRYPNTELAQPVARP